MAEPSIRYSPSPGATPRNEADAVAAVFRFLIERHEAKRTAADLDGGSRDEGGIEEHNRGPDGVAGAAQLSVKGAPIEGHETRKGVLCRTANRAE